MFKCNKFFDLAKSDYSSIFDDVDNIWEILPKIKPEIVSFQNKLSDEYSEIKPGVFVGKGTTIDDNCTIKGPAIIGKNCEIRNSAYIRENVIIGNNVVIGNSCEIKNSFIFDAVQIPHFNYVGDAVIGYKAHMGAGVILPVEPTMM